MLEFTDDLPSLPDRWRHDVLSIQVQEGIWVLYEHPNFRGRQYLMEKGEYRRHTEWGALHPHVGSIRRVLDL